MQCKGVEDCFKQIRSYKDRDSMGSALIVNTENFSEYQMIMNRLMADETIQCASASDYTFANGLPDTQAVLDIIQQEGDRAVLGLAQSLMLRGETALDECVDRILGMPIKDHTVVVLIHSSKYLKKYLSRDPRLNHRIVMLDGERSELPTIQFVKSKDECSGDYVEGIKNLLKKLERVSDSDIKINSPISVVSEVGQGVFKESVYRVIQSKGIYGTLVQKFPEMGYSTDVSYGKPEQWALLLKQSASYSTLASFFISKFGAPSNLVNQLEKVFGSGDAQEEWLFWLSLKMHGTGDDGYFAYVIAHSKESNDLIHHIYQDLIDVQRNEDRFERFFTERKRLISYIPENLSEIKKYCDDVAIHGKDAVYYLTDATEDEEYALMQLVSRYEWLDDELYDAVKHGYPELALYLKKFTFDSMNTKLAESDALLRNVLTEYFQRYKAQKIKNHIEDDFLEEVERFAVERPFYKLQPRSLAVSSMDAKDTQAYFFDALGAEYLSYILAKCEEYGLMYDVKITHCELPSITTKNKDFKHKFDTKDIGDLDELKHHSQTYDYQTCEYPIHIFRELEIIDRELRKIRSALIQNSFEKAVIFSDHGASRLAVIYKHENNSMIELDEKGQHSGRCCPCEEDPHIPQATYEDGYAILANYERFKGGRKANLEVHGGASLEEVVVPIITLTLKPDNINYHFVETVVKIKIGKPVKLELISNSLMKQPRIEVEGSFYNGELTSDRKHATFTVTEQKKRKEYNATVYEGNINTGIVLTFRIEGGTKINNMGL